MTAKIVLATVGSLGDLHPFIALGLALKRRGCAVLLASAAEYRAKTEGAGLAFRAVAPSFASIEQDLGMSRAALTHAVVADPEFLFRRAVLPYLKPSYQDMDALCDGADLLLTSSLAYGARLAAERRGVPWLGIVLQPMMFLSAYDPPVIPGHEWLWRLMRALGPGGSRAVIGLAKRRLARMFGPLAQLRRELGLGPPGADPLFAGQFSPLGAIGLYSAVLGGIQPDFPASAALAGFAAFDSADGRSAALPQALQRFLDEGPAPLVFTLGSSVVNDPGLFFEHSLGAARLLQRRAVLLAGESGAAALQGHFSAQAYIADYAPHSLLFARAAAIVHQGGIGTLAQALRGGRPQLVVPHFADQPDNAMRVRRLGVARTLAPRRYSVPAAARELAALLADGAIAERARALGVQLAAEDGAERAAELVLERLAQARLEGSAAHRRAAAGAAIIVG